LNFGCGIRAIKFCLQIGPSLPRTKDEHRIGGPRSEERSVALAMG
jgi:hypothetical protein